MKNKFSFKKYLFTMYQNNLNSFKSQSKKLNDSSLENLKPVILTSFGYIIGDIITYPPSSEDDIALFLNESLLEKTHSFYDSIPLDERYNDVDTMPYITIANAVVYTFGNSIPTEMKVINLFSEQIVGFSFTDSK